MRINKFLALCGFGSRRKAEKLVISGVVEVNNDICKELSFQVDHKTDTVRVDGVLAKFSNKKLYIMLNKPSGYLVSHKDEFDRKLVYDLLPDFGVHLFAIGRLDYRSQGLLLLTSDGDFSQKVIHPRYKLEKLYKVEVNGFISEKNIEKLKGGIVIDGRKTLPAKVFVKHSSSNRSVLKIILKEGRKRQIRRMIKNVGLEVTMLKRLQIGNLKLKKLPPGMWKFLKLRDLEKIDTSFAKNLDRK